MFGVHPHIHLVLEKTSSDPSAGASEDNRGPGGFQRFQKGFLWRQALTEESLNFAVEIDAIVEADSHAQCNDRLGRDFYPKAHFCHHASHSTVDKYSGAIKVNATFRERNSHQTTSVIMAKISISISVSERSMTMSVTASMPALPGSFQ